MTAKTEVTMRPHHLLRFAYYLKNRKLSVDYGPENTRRLTELYEDIINQRVSRVKIVDGLDSVCEICRKTCNREKPFCAESGEILQDPTALIGMAKTEFELDEPYDTNTFLRGIAKIDLDFPKEEIIRLMLKGMKKYLDKRVGRQENEK